VEASPQEHEEQKQEVRKYSKLCMHLKGTVSGDFLLLVFFHESVCVAVELVELKLSINETYTVKKDYRHSRPQPGCRLPNSLWVGII
jgi:hypothetical protein